MVGQIDEYRGRRIVVRFDGKKCIQSCNCVLGRPELSIANPTGPRIQPDSAPPVNVARIRQTDPIALHASATNAGGQTQLQMTLCRCGGSSNKPFCDDTHQKIGFRG